MCQRKNRLCIVSEILTKHCQINGPFNKLRVVKYSGYSGCKEDDKTFIQILTECLEVQNPRAVYLEANKIEEGYVPQLKTLQILHFLEKIGFLIKGGSYITMVHDNPNEPQKHFTFIKLKHLKINCFLCIEMLFRIFYKLRTSKCQRYVKLYQ